MCTFKTTAQFYIDKQDCWGTRVTQSNTPFLPPMVLTERTPRFQDFKCHRWHASSNFLSLYFSLEPLSAWAQYQAGWGAVTVHVQGIPRWRAVFLSLRVYSTTCRCKPRVYQALRGHHFVCNVHTHQHPATHAYTHTHR